MNHFIRHAFSPIICLAFAATTFSQDTNDNLLADSLDLRNGTSQDCNHNGLPDESESNRPHFSAAVEHLNALEQFTSYVWDACPIDFNQDGKPDVAAVSYPDPDFGYVTLWRNDGGTGLTYQSRFTLGVQLGRILSANIMGDSRPDLVVSDTSMTRVYVLRGTGDGTFAPPVSLIGDASNNGLGGVAIGDLDNDGDIDVAASCWGQHTVNVWKNNGNGTFGLKTSYPVGYNPRGVAIGDVSGDGLADIAVANSWEFAPPPVGDGKVTLLRNTGAATFTADATYSMPQNVGPFGIMRPRPRDLALCDTDHDGDRDMIVSSRDSERLDLWTNNGGTFILAGAIGSGYYLGSDAAAVICRDLDDDGWEDVAWTDSEAYSVNLYKNNNGSFSFRQSFATGHLGSVSISAADFDADGKTDLLVGNHALRTFCILRNKGNLLFDAALRLRPSQYPSQSVLADFNNDGITDYGATDQSTTTTLGFFVYLGTGDGTFGPPIQTSPVPGTGFYYARDVNHDNNLDLLVVYGGCRVFLGNGNGTFQPEIVSPPIVLLRNVVSDFNQDGQLDIAWISPGHPGTLYRSFGDGTGNFAPGVAVEVVPAEDEAIGFGDITGDNVPEVFTGHAQGLAQPGGIFCVYTNDGNGNFGPRQDRLIVAQPLSPAIGAIACADFDMDGDRDVVVSALGLQFYPNPGDGNLPATPTVVSSLGGSILTVADIDLDGDPDLYGRATRGIAFFNNGQGVFAKRVQMHFYDSNARGMVVGDVNNDQRPDMLIEPENSWDKYIYLNRPPASADGNVNGVPDDCEITPIPGDIDGDGDVDLTDRDLFVAVLVNADLDPGHVQRSDVNQDGAANGADVGPFIQNLLLP